MTHDARKTLEETTACRLFSERVIQAVTDHKYLETIIDDDEANDLAYSAIELLRTHDTAIVVEALRDAINHFLKDEPKLLARLLADLGLVLDCKLLDLEMREHTRNQIAAAKA